MKPKIILVSEEGYANNIPHFMIPCDYGTAVGNAGGLPLVALDATHPHVYESLGDGLLLTGGTDLHYGRYGDVYAKGEALPSTLSLSREAFEFELCRLFLQTGKPIFGIGRGLQVLNAVLGGTLHHHIDNHRRTDENGVFGYIEHPLTVTTTGALSTLLPNEVNSCHHQAIKELGNGLIAIATAGDIVEAAAHETLPAFGVQWHPQHEESGNALFSYFVSLCKEGVR